YLNLKWKEAKMRQSIERLEKEAELRGSGYLVPNKNDKKETVSTNGIHRSRVRTIIGTTYYIDADNGNNSADGLTPTGDATNGPWATLDQFTENSRNPGDICILRR